jgi:hypothetical protein
MKFRSSLKIVPGKTYKVSYRYREGNHYDPRYIGRVKASCLCYPRGSSDLNLEDQRYNWWSCFKLDGTDTIYSINIRDRDFICEVG